MNKIRTSKYIPYLIVRLEAIEICVSELINFGKEKGSDPFEYNHLREIIQFPIL